ncbi:MAG: DNA-directed RNA polymerase subunit L [Candidatus Diapherotrites archaeon]|nr:DNA-directed RNA polymerase subunit L [Candidatus Diapherotrites archaeon]
MEIEIINAEKNFIEFYLRGEKHSFPTLLKMYLLKDSAVVFASYDLDHPIIGTPRFVVRTDGSKSADKVLENAVKEILKDVDDMRKSLVAKK